MTETQLRPLLILLEQVERERDQAMGREQHARATHDQAQVQAAQLNDYQREYTQRWGAQPQQSASIEILHCYHNFMGQLGRAIEHQNHQIEHTHRLWQAAMAQLQQLQMRVASIEKLIERRRLEARSRAERQEQKTTDEQAARVALGRGGFGPGSDFMPI